MRVIFFFILIERSSCQAPTLTTHIQELIFKNEGAAFQRGEALSDMNHGSHETLLADVFSFFRHIADTHIKNTYFYLKPKSNKVGTPKRDYDN